MSSSLRSRPPGSDQEPRCGSRARCHNSTFSCGFPFRVAPLTCSVAWRTWNTTASTSCAVLPLGMFSIISRKPPKSRGVAVPVLNRMDTLAEDLVASITNSPAGYGGVDGDEQWANEIRRLAELRGATVLAHNYQL